jgi:hypothetical protein
MLRTWVVKNSACMLITTVPPIQKFSLAYATQNRVLATFTRYIFTTSPTTAYPEPKSRLGKILGAMRLHR